MLGYHRAGRVVVLNEEPFGSSLENQDLPPHSYEVTRGQPPRSSVLEPEEGADSTTVVAKEVLARPPGDGGMSVRNESVIR
jgi:hypothetical protein